MFSCAVSLCHTMASSFSLSLSVLGHLHTIMNRNSADLTMNMILSWAQQDSNDKMNFIVKEVTFIPIEPEMSKIKLKIGHEMEFDID